MIYLTLFYSFFLIGLFAIGGGAATIPFLFDLIRKYHWFTASDLTNMIAVSEATPGPLGVNMATFAGFETAGILGGITATFGLVLPSVIIVVTICKFINKFACDEALHRLLKPVQPAVVALILNAAFKIATIGIKDLLTFGVFCFILLFMRYYKAGSIFYIVLSGVIGFALKL